MKWQLVRYDKDQSSIAGAHGTIIFDQCASADGFLEKIAQDNFKKYVWQIGFDEYIFHIGKFDDQKGITESALKIRSKLLEMKPILECIGKELNEQA